MINVGTYIKLLLKKRNMTQTDLAKKMKELGFKDANVCHINNLINNTDKEIRYSLIRKIEIALKLPEYSLVKMAGVPSKLDWKRIKEVKVDVRSKKKKK